MSNKVGIRIEDKYELERRCPIIPEHVRLLHEKYGIEFHIQSSSKRIFSDEEFKNNGAIISEKVPDTSLLVGIKEMPPQVFKEGKTYMFFSHTIKGQSYNMPALKTMVEKKINLLDYEKMRDDQGRRSIFFGRFAGLAGMINTLWAYGQRLKAEDIITPFTKLKQARFYNSLAEAISVIEQIKSEIQENGLPAEISPVVIGVTGYGHVGSGVKEILMHLPVTEIKPDELLDASKKINSSKTIYITTFRENDIVEPKFAENEFELQDYYDNPDKYNSKFSKYLDHLSILVNSMYWDTRYPKLVTHEFLKKFYNKDHKLKCIGDITCDPGGSIEITHRCTTIEHPVFTFDPQDEKYFDAFAPKGITVLAVDILPSELPRESSIEFSNMLFEYYPSIVNCDFSKKYEDLDLIPEVKRGLILHNGEFTPEFIYMNKFI